MENFIRCEVLNCKLKLIIPEKNIQVDENFINNFSDTSYNFFYNNNDNKLYFENIYIYKNYLGTTFSKNEKTAIKLIDNSGAYFFIQDANKIEINNLDYTNYKINITNNEFISNVDFDCSKSFINCNNIYIFNNNLIIKNDENYSNIDLSFNSIDVSNVDCSNSTFNNIRCDDINDISNINVSNVLDISNNLTSNSILPVGSIISWCGILDDNKPNIQKNEDVWLINEKFLYCNGAICSKNDYPDLLNIIHNEYDGNDNTDTQNKFKLPDLRGRTLFGNADLGYINNEKYIGNKYFDSLEHIITHGHKIDKYGTFITEEHIVDHSHNLIDHTHENISFDFNYTDYKDDDSETFASKQADISYNFIMEETTFNDVSMPVYNTYHKIKNIITDVNENSNITNNHNDMEIKLPSIIIHFLIKAKK